MLNSSLTNIAVNLNGFKTRFYCKSNEESFGRIPRVMYFLMSNPLKFFCCRPTVKLKATIKDIIYHFS